jgi:hypothetical protein
MRLRVVLFVLATALGAVAFSAAPAFAAAPEAPTIEVPSRTPTTVLLEGVVEPNGGAFPVEPGTYEFLYKKSASECEGAGHAPASPGMYLGMEPERLSTVLTGLEPGGQYTACLKVENDKSELAISSAATFTLLPEAPETSSPASTVTATHAVLEGTLNPGMASKAGWYFAYNEGASCQGGSETAHEAEVEGKAIIEHSEVTGLQPSKPYTFCLVATNELGETAQGDEVTVTTLAAAPTIAKEAVSAVEATAATLNAEINPGGAATIYHFEYVSEAQFERDGFSEPMRTPESGSIGAEDTAHAVAPVRITGLQPGTTYHYRVVATNNCEGGEQCVTDGPEKTLTTNPAPGSEPAQNCPDEARRLEQASTYLSDCRAYELVTPAEKDSGEPSVHEGLGAHAAVDGERMAWFAQTVIPGSETPGMIYLSARRQDGWSSETVIPPQSVENGILCPELVGMDAWSADLEKGVLADGWGQGGGSRGEFFEEGTECGHDEPRLVAGEPEGLQNLFVRDNENFVRDNATGVNPYQLVNVTPSAVPPPAPSGGVYYPAFFLAGSADLSHVVFEEELPLTEDAPGYPSGWEGDDDLYEWTSSGVRLVTTLPDGTPTQGSLAGATRNAASEAYNIADYLHAVSDALPGQGSRVFFQAGGNLYVRENAEQEQSAVTPGSTLVNGEQCTEQEKACTVQVDASRASPPGPGGGQFMEANETGSQVFFTDENRLTADSKAEPGKPDLYEYDLEKPLGERLTDLTADSAEPADVLGVSGAGEDGSRVYFVAQGVLTAEPDRSLLKGKQSAVPGDPNLYAYEPDPADAGAYRTVFIATLATGDSCDWIEVSCAGERSGLTARVSANGAFIGFTSAAKLTSYDNTDANTGSPDSEIYLYDAATETLSCASCDPSGAAPASGAGIGPPVTPYNFSRVTDAYPQRYVSNNGQLFFQTAEALLPADTNAELDVYEYEGGQLYLISSGASDEASYFLDASVSGSDVFFETAQRLLPRDQDAAYDIYDARVNGGFPEPAAPAASCVTGEGCAGAAPGAPVFSTPTSASFLGAGNLTPAPSKPKTAAQIKAEKLASALRACRAKHGKHRRARCASRARKRYGGAAKAKRSAKTDRRGK